MSTDRPVVFLAFADARSDLSSVKFEGWSLRDQFDELKKIVDVVVEERATLERIYNVFQSYRDRIAIFHFGGHADGDRLLLESALEPPPAFAGGLASLLGEQRGLKVVFLNGCSTRPQVKRLLDSGVPCVIATSRAIDDGIATSFAKAFYQALTKGDSGKGRRTTGGCNLARAFNQASGFTRAETGGKFRDLDSMHPVLADIIADEPFPWKIQYRPGSEHIARWTLFEHDPLFGLPELPTKIAWPMEPYRDLSFFEREHARIFFGRGRAIREMYDLLAFPAGLAGTQLIFYYGQTGVGKTSVLAAGLLPRLETRLATKYTRRNAHDGLLGTLRTYLASGVGAFDLGAAWSSAERDEKRPLLIVLDQAEEAFTRPRANVSPRDEVHELFEALRGCFSPARPDRPEGRLVLSFRKEWLAEFEEIRKTSGLDAKSMMLAPLDQPGVIEAIEGPADHFNLVIRPDRHGVKPDEDSLVKFLSNDLFDTLADPQTEQESPIAPTLQILLSRMWKEANEPGRLNGRPTFDRKLYQHMKDKGFMLKEVIEQQFAEIAKVEGLGESVEKGLLLDLLEFFTTHDMTAETRTRKEIAARYPTQPDRRLDNLLECCKGFLLADARTGKDGSKAYRLTHDTLAPLIRELCRVSVKPAQRARHVLEGRVPTWQRGDNEAVLDLTDLAAVEEGVAWTRALDKDELALLEASRQDKVSRVAKEEKQQRQLKDAEDGKKKATESKLRATIIGLGMSLILLGAALWEWRSATKQKVIAEEQTKEVTKQKVIAEEQTKEATKQKGVAEAKTSEAELSAKEARVQREKAVAQAGLAESRRLAAEVTARVTSEPIDFVMLLAEESLKYAETREARASLQLALDSRKEVASILHLPGRHIGSVAFAPDGRIAAGIDRDAGGVVLFDASGKPLSPKPLPVEEGLVMSMAFGPEGRLAAGYGDLKSQKGGVVVFDASGNRLTSSSLKVEEGVVWNVAYSSDGRIAAGYQEARDNPCGIAMFGANGQPLTSRPLPLGSGVVRSLAFGPEGKLAAAFDHGVVVFDKSGKRLTPEPLQVTQGDDRSVALVRSVAFAADGRIAAAFGPPDGDEFVDKAHPGQSRVVVFDATGKPSTDSRLDVPEGKVMCVAFGSDGKLAAGFDDNSLGGGVALFGVKGNRLTREPLALREGRLRSLAFGPDGRLAVAFEGSTGSGVVFFDLTASGPIQVSKSLTIAEGNVRSVAFGPDGRIGAGFGGTPSGGGVVLFDASGRRLASSPLPVKDGDVWSVAFGTDGRLAAGYGDPKSQKGGVALFDVTGKPLTDKPLRIDNGKVRSVAFGHDNRLVAGFLVTYTT